MRLPLRPSPTPDKICVLASGHSCTLEKFQQLISQWFMFLLNNNKPLLWNKLHFLYIKIKINNMVIGNGLVANAFKMYKNDEDYLVFASGVSNSANKDPQQFEREKLLLERALKDNSSKMFIYFSTCSLYDSSLKGLPYVNHKLNMEALIQKEHNNYRIFRISNLAGKTNNPNTMLNFFFQHIASGTFFNVWKNATRNIIDIDDAVLLCDYIINHGLFKNDTVNIANPHNYNVQLIVKTMEKVIGKKGNYGIIDKSSIPEIDTTDITPLIETLNINFDDGYLLRTLKKYYAQL
jgi:nucleoside-diphosphate-sugar epimerase